jgi:hypothetical protein
LSLLIGGFHAFCVSAIPSAFMSGSSPHPYQVIGGNAYVGYTVAAFPVAISLQSTTLVNGAQKALTGQPITASLIFPNGGPPGATLSNYQWDIESADGASIVGGYAPSQASGKTLSIGSFQSPNVTFYDGIQDTVTVNATAIIKFSDNTTGTLKATTQLMFVKPTATQPMPFQLTEHDNFAQHPNDTSSIIGAIEAWAGVRITMPPGFSGGTGCFAQLIGSTARTDTRHTGGTYTEKVQLSNGTWAAIPTPCLDTNFSYPFAIQWQVSSSGSGVDQPYFLVAPPLNAGDNGGHDWYQAVGNDQFNIWVMYNPNVQNSADIWVPLASFNWNWSNMAALNVNLLPPAWQANAFVGSSGTLTPTGIWPTWTTYIPSGELSMHQ